MIVKRIKISGEKANRLEVCGNWIGNKFEI